MHLKPGVDLDGLAPAGQRIFDVLVAAGEQLGHDITITCTTGDHGPHDSHTHGNAIDCRTFDLTVDQIVNLYRFMSSTLGPDYTVLYEVPIADRNTLDMRLRDLVYEPSNPNAQHLHVQWSLRAGPPPPRPV